MELFGGFYQLCNGKGEIDYFVGIEQQSVWIGIVPDPYIALRPEEGEVMKYPLFAAGISWKEWKPFQRWRWKGTEQGFFPKI